MELRGYTMHHLLDVDLDAVVAALDHPEIHEFVGDTRPRYVARYEREHRGDSFTLAAEKDGVICGTVGVLGYPADPAVFQTATILAPRFFGTGLNKLARAVQWEIGIMTGRPLIATIHVDNGRSITATARLHPEASVEHVHEEWMPRDAAVFRLDRPPVGVAPLSPAELDELTAIVKRTPFSRFLVR